MTNYQSVIDSKINLVTGSERKISLFKRFTKRIFDLLFSLLGIIVLSPIFIIVAIWIKLSTKDRIIYKQQRMGKNLKLFNIYKFQTMVPDADKIGPLVTVGNDPRVTKPGRVLRKYKIDELPQLFNVLFGTMSFVGPRPEVPKYLPYYSDEHLKLFTIKPGITDISSIELRDEELFLEENSDRIDYYETVLLPQKLNNSLTYLEKYSVLYDVKLILKTIKKVVFS
ncbi:sugar transferase [Erysipelothrix sp. strain 2 (EsS2-7-Brazil)]|uniref:sugar transferase n=1 Tax=Erysipelothrix sp. strain 2 (EsS2-7-Brazil) TaxID=2500579 RepID=UPI00190934B8|nr:sugar transferase [Erysipelothrix sp. strain 2 (EsS2-7-Brazil)]MBK2404691.1 sugar transferase [Erysipelothrix sp. strain 2 (EsS2-7-Brazil)]